MERWAAIAAEGSCNMRSRPYTHAAVHDVPGRPALKTPMDGHSKLILDAFRNVQPVYSSQCVMPVCRTCQHHWWHIRAAAFSTRWSPWTLTTRPTTRVTKACSVSSQTQCLSVRPTHACIVRKLNDALQIFLYHTKGQSLCYCDTQEWLVGNAPFPLKSALKVTRPLRKTDEFDRFSLITSQP